MDFRIWDTKKRKYTDAVKSGANYIIEKNTGFIDNEGNPIYENDVWMRLKPIYFNEILFMATPGRCGYLLIFKLEDGTWSLSEEDCDPCDGVVVGTIHDVEWI